MKHICCLFLIMLLASPVKADFWTFTYENNLVYHYQNIYRMYFGSTQWERGNDHRFRISKKTPHAEDKVYAWIKQLKSIEVKTHNSAPSQYNYATLMRKIQNEYIVMEDHKHWVPRVAFEDDPGDSEIVLHNNGVYYYTNSAHAIGKAGDYPPRWRPWTKPIDIDVKWTPYCGMIDDDIMYDWRKENPFQTILTHNKKGPFLYVYNFNMYRDRIQDWAFHDRLIHGWKSHGTEEDSNPAQLTYGPLLDNANHEIARAVRIYTFIRLYLAKLRLAKLLHPAPAWDEDRGDYNTSYMDARLSTIVSQKDFIDPEMAGRKFVPDDVFIKRIIDAPNDDYWRMLGSKIVIPTESIDALRKKDWKKARLWGSIAHHFEVFKDLYMYKMFVRSPLQKANDFLRYAQNQYLSIALWDGQNGYGEFRHEFRGGLKYFYPYFERVDKIGNTHVPRFYLRGRWKNAPSNTTGLIYAGHMSGEELHAYCRSTGSDPLQVWKDAIAGPFMIISDRTLKRYGRAYFEKLAGHSLKTVDVTGALIASAARVQLALDPDQLKQLTGMDYFYYKNNKDEKRGSHTMLPASSITIMPHTIKMTGAYNPSLIVRNPITTEIKALRNNDRSTSHFRNIDYFNYIIHDIKNGLVLDEKQFPGMSIRATNYLPYHKGEIVAYPRKEQIYFVICTDSPQRGGAVILNDVRKLLTRNKVPGIRWIRRNKDAFIAQYLGKPRTPRNIEFLAEVHEMKQENVIRNLHTRYGYTSLFLYQLQLVLADRIPWMAYNPHLFLAYYRHIEKLMLVHERIVSKTTDGREIDNGICDGTMVWYGSGRLRGAQVAPLYAARKYAENNQTIEMLWCYAAYGYGQKGVGNSLLVGGKMRKQFARGLFPWWETTVGFVEGSPFSPWYYHHTYKWLQNSSGSYNLMRDPSWFINRGNANHGNRVELFSKLFPGMIRFVFEGIIDLPIKHYAHIPYEGSYIEFSSQPDLRTLIHAGHYQGATGAYLGYVSNVFDNISDQKIYIESIKNLNAMMASIPVDNHTFVITDGIQTTILKRKKSVVFNVINNSLYEKIDPL